VLCDNAAPKTVAGGSSGSLKCHAWADMSPAAAGAEAGSLLPLKSSSSIAVRLSTGVLIAYVADGTIQHATFVRGKPLAVTCVCL